MSKKALLMITVLGLSLAAVLEATTSDHSPEYRVLATSKTSTMERELNEAGAAGYRLSAAMGGDTAAGGKEIVVAMVKMPEPGVREYKLLATSRTSTMQKELQDAANE